MLAILGAVLLLPLALVTLVVGCVRFAVRAAAAAGGAALSHLAHTH